MTAGFNCPIEAWIDHQIVDGYTRIPPSTPHEWGGTEAVGDAATREVLRRLDHEEALEASRRRADLDPEDSAGWCDPAL